MMTADDLLQQGIAAYKAGLKSEARSLFKRVLDLDPGSEQAWLWLGGAVDNDQERRHCLELVLAINPANETARQGLARLRMGQRPAAPLAGKTAARRPTPLRAGMDRRGGKGARPASRLPRSRPTLEPASRLVPLELGSPQPVTSYQPPEELPEPVTPQGRTQPGTRAPEVILHEPSPMSQPSTAKRGRRTPPLFWALVLGLGLTLVGVIAAFLFRILVPGFELGGASPVDPPDAITSVVYENIAAHNAEDVDRYIATMHPQSPDYAELRQVLEEMYSAFDLQSTLSDVELLEASTRGARVSFVLVTRKIHGPDFRDNRVQGVFVLRKQDGEWRLQDQEIASIEYLD
jgi:hypothetical protein